MIFRILGDLEVRPPGGGPVVLPGGRQLSVLAALLIKANQQLSTAELLRAGWGDPEVSPAQLHKAVSALRRLVALAGRPGSIKTHNRFGYELKAATADLDLLQFRWHVDRADAERREQHIPQEIEHLRAAIRLWRGASPLANVPDAPFAAEIGALRSRRKRSAVRLFTLEHARGEHAAILDDLAQFFAEDPADGQLCRLLMFSLYRSGHAAEAMAALERHEEAVEGGADKGLRRLGYAMAMHNDELVAKADEASARTPREVPLPRQLPPAPASFVGREDLVAELGTLLRDRRRTVLVISGPGGMGKTALALRAAHDAADLFPGGQLWADLRGSSDQPVDPGEVLAEFLRALGETTVPESRRERIALFRTLTAGRKLLLVLDDAGSVAQIRDLIPGGGTSIVLVTARRRLPGIDAAVHHVPTLEALDQPTAAALFRNVVEAAQVDVSGEREAVEAVVRLCGGLPLALRIAAQMRVEDFHRPTAELLGRLREQGPAAFRHGDESLARTIGAGLAPLDDLARRLFLGLGLLAQPTFGEWTAAALLQEPGPAAGAALARLALVGMVDPVHPGARYGFHDLTRDYARDRAAAELKPPEESVEAPARVCRALLTLTRRAHDALYGGRFDVVHSDEPDVAVPEAETAAMAGDPRTWFEIERLNIRAAVGQAAALGLTGVCWDLAVSAHEFYAIGQYFDDWRVTHEIALAECRRAGDRRGEGVVLVALGQPPLVASGSPGVSGVAELERAQELLAEVGERHGRAVALRTLANALRRRGEMARPLQQFTEALVHYRESGDVVGVQQTLRFIGQAHLDMGHPDAAVATLREAERVGRELGQPQVLAPTLYWMGHAYLARGNQAAAEAAFAEVYAMFPDGGIGHAYALHGLGDVALVSGDLDMAAARLSRAEECAREGADVVLEGRIYLTAAALEAARGARIDQEVDLLRAVELFQWCGAAHLEIAAQAALADAYALAQDQPEAEAAARDRIRELAAGLPPEDRPKL
ncbi:BTAD domain-containing putative transcriptional regulator [Actinoplanes sp. Pm04-4]|uniref:BTAD domain-containing putative transcriptional regulator n=1 Tax=Paractinoplanes pyxinae TaxID=2997416 RepID=A0ABT4AYN2_9ACTN|nr:BTAD domain-containing putative transcriptional regulator [Actinoplanes pyxinae]MCY1139351.1 BTAD domain-containing putative transcriptional regulator [Actinoplanes pyxinae]